MLIWQIENVTVSQHNTNNNAENKDQSEKAGHFALQVKYGLRLLTLAGIWTCSNLGRMMWVNIDSMPGVARLRNYW